MPEYSAPMLLCAPIHELESMRSSPILKLKSGFRALPVWKKRVLGYVTPES